MEKSAQAGEDKNHMGSDCNISPGITVNTPVQVALEENGDIVLLSQLCRSRENRLFNNAKLKSCPIPASR
jgi:hypothetical protein